MNLLNIIVEVNFGIALTSKNNLALEKHSCTNKFV